MFGHIAAGARAGLLAGGFLLAATPLAQAGFVQVRDGNGGNAFNGGPGHMTIGIRVNGASKNVHAGAFALQYRTDVSDPWIDFLTYCLEPDELLGITGTPRTGDLVSDTADAPAYAAKAEALGRLYTTWFTDSLTDRTSSAAFQVALWETAYDTGGDLGAGAFRLNTKGAVRTRALAYLHQANWLPEGSSGVIVFEGKQDLIVPGPDPSIPVPGPAALGLFGLALAGLVFARRRMA